METEEGAEGVSEGGERRTDKEGVDGRTNEEKVVVVDSGSRLILSHTC